MRHNNLRSNAYGHIVTNGPSMATGCITLAMEFKEVTVEDLSVPTPVANGDVTPLSTNYSVVQKYPAPTTDINSPRRYRNVES